ncbi:MAG: hypothetical protein AB7S70_00520 [Hyphomicrobium sp.]|uniref:hypothetical protein n=1 Tax=Hyphomicrobium sp. TaxID=82 RepID=UPI003D09F365
MTTQEEKIVQIGQLYTAIIARATGKQVSQAGHKDKQTSFSPASLNEMIRLYRSLWFRGCGYPQLSDLGQPVVERGPPARFWH